MQERTVTFNTQVFRVHLRDEADESVLAEIFKLREYRIAEEIIKNAVDPVIDIGAHSGLFTLYARALNPDVRLVAVEPEPGNLALLRQHLLENKISRVEVAPVAVAEETGKGKLLISKDSHNHRLVRENEMGMTVSTVSTYSLPDLFKKFKIARASLIKMDIEGGEYEVYERLKIEDYKIIEAIIMEYHDLPDHDHKEIEKLLRENGFGVQIFPSKFDKTMGFLFAKNKRK